MKKCYLTVLLYLFVLTLYSQDLEWMISGAGNQNISIDLEVEYIHSIVSTSTSIYATAFATGTETTVDGTVIPSSNLWFLLKFDLNGSLVWYRELEETFGPCDVTTDPSGNIWVSGSTSLKCYLRKYNEAGDLIIEKVFMKNAVNPAPYGLATDSDGNMYTCGLYQHSGTTFTEEDTIFTEMTSSYHAFLIKYNNEAEFQWMATTNAGGQGWFRDITTDGMGGVIVTGDFDSEEGNPLLIGDQELISVENSMFVSQEALIARFSAENGTLDWVKHTEGLDNEFGNKVTVDGEHNIYFTGTYTGATIFGEEEISAAGAYDIYLIKLDQSGTLQWIRSAGGPQGSIQLSDDFLVEAGRSVTTDADNNIYISGTFISSATFAGGSNENVLSTTSNKQAGYIAKYTSDGTLLWARGGTGEKSAVLDITVRDRKIYFAGNFFPTANFLNEVIPVTTPNSMNFFLGAAAQPEMITALNEAYASKIALFPNPAHDYFNVRFTTQTSRELKLFDLKGSMVRQYNSNDFASRLDVSGLMPGMYTLVIIDGNSSSCLRLLKI